MTKTLKGTKMPIPVSTTKTSATRQSGARTSPTMAGIQNANPYRMNHGPEAIGEPAAQQGPGPAARNTVRATPPMYAEVPRSWMK